MESCEVCGFEWDAVAPAEIQQRVIDAAQSIVTELLDNPELAVDRPQPTHWSMLEYAAHVRDVLLNLRDRMLLGAIEDNPTPKAMHADARVALGLYEAEHVEVVATELIVAASLFDRAFVVLDADQLQRPIFYGWPRPTTRTLLWVAAQAVHETEHHLGDVTATRDLLWT